MSILTETLPEQLVICGKECPIRTDFRVWLQFSEEISAPIDSAEKAIKIFSLVFYKLPPNFFDAINAVLEFYAHGERGQNTGGKSSKENVFDFAFDGNRIYAAFMQQYGIDLTRAEMHWWKFKALFDNLSEDTQFMRVVQYRSMNLAQIKDKEQKKFYTKMKSIYKLPDKRSEAQKEIDFNDSMSDIFG